MQMRKYGLILALTLAVLPVFPDLALAAETSKTTLPVKNTDNTPAVHPEMRKQLEVLSTAMHQEARTVGNDLRDDEDVAATDIAMLFQAAVEKNNAVRFAINKLSSRDETGKPVQNDGMIKRLVSGAAGLAGAAGSMVTGSPAAMMGGNMVQEMLSSDGGTDPYQHRVTDADLVLLAREIDKVQCEVIEKYYNYRYAKERAQLAGESRQTVEKYMDQALKKDPAQTDTPMRTIMETLSDSAHQDEDRIQQEYVTARNALVLLVGPETVLGMEEAKKQIKATQQKADAAPTTTAVK